MGRLRKSIVVSAILALSWAAVRTEIARRYGIPSPEIHDEFSYLLGADTFASGRLANPPHPMAEFFESPQILVRPVYASKYPPGHALILALGQKAFGSPFYGIVIEGALMIFTVGLAAGVWVPLTWATLVSLVLALYMLPPNYWVNSYWGGCLAASGGALVLLAAGLDRGNRRVAAGLTFGLGVAVLFLTRPYEGAVFTLAVLVLHCWRSNPRTLLMPAAVSAPVILAALVWTGYYNRAVTGSAFLLPYALHDRQYNVTPSFWIAALRPEPGYSHPRLAAQHGARGQEASEYGLHYPWWKGVWRGFGISLLCVSVQVAGYLGFAVLAVPLAWNDPRFRQLAVVLGVFLAALSIESWHLQHYAAPALAAVAVITALWLERLWQTNSRGVKAGRAVAIVFLAFAASFALQAAAAVRAKLPGADRQELIARLSTLDKPQLVLVHYPSPDWNVGTEWVYNGASIDAQRVIFAHDLGPERNGRLLAYYANREVWRVSLDDRGYRIERVK